MNDTVLTSADRAEKLQGLGCKRKRVEDVRFVQGKGNYVDDLKLPGMIYGDFVRSPHAHARIKSIDASKAKALPGVLAVLTAADLKPLGLHYMPTLAGDVQAVLAEEKVLFQNQEVAFVIATDRYIAADGADLVDVEYEPLPVIVDPFKSMAPDAPLLREDIKDKMDGAHGKRKHYNHIFSWEMGDRDGTDAAFKKAEVSIKELISYQRVHPAPLETCQCVASFDKIRGELTVWGTFQAPHVIRTVASLISKIPEHKIHVISPDIGGGFGNKVGAYSGYICAIVASIVTGVPVKWVEDRIENLTTTAFARDYHMTAEIAATKDGRVTALRVNVLADHGAFDACADPSSGRPASSISSPAPTISRSRIVRSTASIPTRRRAGSPIAAPSASPKRPIASSGRWTSSRQARHGPGRAQDEEPHQAGAVSLHLGVRLGIRLRRLPDRLEEGDGNRRLSRSFAPSKRRSRRPSSAARLAN